jgi:hypothetical protein
MNCFYQSCAETNLATLNYVTFVEPFVMLPTEALSFNDAKFMSNYTNEVFEFAIIFSQSRRDIHKGMVHNSCVVYLLCGMCTKTHAHLCSTKKINLFAWIEVI